MDILGYDDIRGLLHNHDVASAAGNICARAPIEKGAYQCGTVRCDV
jgi:hypothetical protein